MSNPDALAQRAFMSEVDGHREEARQALELVIQNATSALVSLDHDVRTDYLRCTAQYAAEAVAHGNALHALNRVAGLITGDT